MVCDRSYRRGVPINSCKLKIASNLYLVSRIILIRTIAPVKERLSFWRSNSCCRLNVSIRILRILFAIFRSCSGAFTLIICNSVTLSVYIIWIKYNIVI